MDKNIYNESKVYKNQFLDIIESLKNNLNEKVLWLNKKRLKYNKKLHKTSKIGSLSYDIIPDDSSDKLYLEYDNVGNSSFFHKSNLNHIPKYKISFCHIPVFSDKFDILDENKVNNEDLKSIDYYSLSKIEYENKKYLIQKEEKKIKYDSTSYAVKEQMDSNNLKKLWNSIVKFDLPKVHRDYQKFKQDTDYNSKRLMLLCQKEVRRKGNKVFKQQKETLTRARKLQKDMMIFWRRKDKEVNEQKKKKNKTELEKIKKQEELEEAIRQKKRLEYLMTQSDIYSFFMSKKLGIEQEINKINNENEEKNKDIDNDAINKINNEEDKIIKVLDDGTKVFYNKENKLVSLDVVVDNKVAEDNILNLISNQKNELNKFDENTNKLRVKAGGEEVKMSNDNTSCNINNSLDNPNINTSIESPSSFFGNLKHYQLKGLNWLDNLFEQGINGILADEMGLGKTIQAIALLAHISERRNNWGPFLVISPNATLYNWQQEVNKFCPNLKVLPYWGGLKERKTLRKFFNPSNLYTKQSSFHVCITSYQFIVQDQKVFHKINWQYMILDEAHSIKNVNSIRWNTLLEFSCRNRLLLTGTPIQNSMSELWALLHFIMPKLFDSHEQFQEWFSKDIEAHSQQKGELNKEQLKRLHTILKPFMLRRVKKDVENEIGPKTEIEISCEMTKKQSLLYNTIKKKLSNISDLFTSIDSKLKVENLMNLVMQFRKVCNHPELFERNIGKIPFNFRDLTNRRSTTYIISKEDIHYCQPDRYSAIGYYIPKLIYDEIVSEKNKIDNIRKNLNILNIFSEYIFMNKSIGSYKSFINNSLFNILKMLPYKDELFKYKDHDEVVFSICLLHYTKKYKEKKEYIENNMIENFFNNYSYSSPSILIYKSKDFLIQNKDFLYINYNFFNNICISDTKTKRFYIPSVLSYLPDILCSSKSFHIRYNNQINNPLYKKLIFGFDFLQKEILPKSIFKYFSIFPHSSQFIREIQHGTLYSSFPSHFNSHLSLTQFELPSFERLVSECSKLKTLDSLLIKLYHEGHRVLIFCQMTKMIDILEEYMGRRRFSYFRMDGSTDITDRRDMVNEFQSSGQPFAFLLSTRAGGLGVNLTAADTVIFYDNDWNPTMDAQATDRVHRIGQIKPVTIYRLVTKNSIEERILKRAQQKQNVQTTVYSGGAFKADIFKQSEIFELLYSDEEVKKIEEERKKIQVEYSSKIQIQKQQLEEEAEEKKKQKKQKKEDDKKIKQTEKENEKKKDGKGKSLFAVKKSVQKEKIDDIDDDIQKYVVLDENNNNYMFDMDEGDNENTDSIKEKKEKIGKTKTEEEEEDDEDDFNQNENENENEMDIDNEQE